MAEIPAFEAYWKAAGASQVVVRRMHTNANSTPHLTPQTTAAEPRRPCLYPWERILLTPTGYLAFCPQDWIHASAVADYRTTTIRETWQGEFFRRLRDAHLRNNFCDHKFCGQCPDWKTTRWPGSGQIWCKTCRVDRWPAEPFPSIREGRHQTVKLYALEGIF